MQILFRLKDSNLCKCYIEQIIVFLSYDTTEDKIFDGTSNSIQIEK